MFGDILAEIKENLSTYIKYGVMLIIAGAVLGVVLAFIKEPEQELGKNKVRAQTYAESHTEKLKTAAEAMGINENITDYSYEKQLERLFKVNFPDDYVEDEQGNSEVSKSEDVKEENSKNPDKDKSKKSKKKD